MFEYEMYHLVILNFIFTCNLVYASSLLS